MVAQQPEVARLRHRVGWRLRHLVLLDLARRLADEGGDLLLAEPRHQFVDALVCL